MPTPTFRLTRKADLLRLRLPLRCCAPQAVWSQRTRISPSNHCSPTRRSRPFSTIAVPLQRAAPEGDCTTSSARSSAVERGEGA
eukprot:7346323-Prymnesium_polylepis.2